MGLEVQKFPIGNTRAIMMTREMGNRCVREYGSGSKLVDEILAIIESEKTSNVMSAFGCFSCRLVERIRKFCMHWPKWFNNYLVNARKLERFMLLTKFVLE